MKVLGFDISGKWWGPGDWDAIAKPELGIKFVSIRVSMAVANNAIETEWLYPEQLEGAQRKGLLRGAYCYFIPRSDWQKQIDVFIDELSISRPWAWNMPPTIDVEESWVTPTKATPMIAAFVYALRERLNVKRPLIYTRASFWNNAVLGDPAWNSCDLWASRENPLLTSPWSDKKFTFRDWVDTETNGYRGWKFWQYEFQNDFSRDYGFTRQFQNRYGVWVSPARNMDLNWFNGSLEELYAYAGEEMPPQPPTLEQKLDHLVAWAKTQGYTGPGQDNGIPATGAQ